MAKIHYLFNAGCKAMVHLANMANVNWTDCILKKQDVALSQFTKDIYVKDKRDLNISLVYTMVFILVSKWCIREVFIGCNTWTTG